MAARLEDLLITGAAPQHLALIRALAGALAPWPLFPGQEDALRHSPLLTEANTLLVAPTGAGKSVLGEAAMVRHLVRGGAALWLVPTRALARERARRLRSALEPQGLRVAVSTRDDARDDAAIREGRVDVAVLVYEKALLMGLRQPGWRRSIRCIIADEAQLVEDPERGAFAELLLALWLKEPEPPRLIALTSGLADEERLLFRLRLERYVLRDRPVALRRGLLSPAAGALLWEDAPKPESWPAGENPAALVAHLLERCPRPILLFAGTRWEARQWADAAAQALPEAAEQEPPKGKDHTLLGGELARLQRHGVAFHTAEMTARQRARTESLLRHGKLAFCAATTTLAEGVNLGAATVVVLPSARLRAGGRLDSLMGRAGRPGGEAEGQAMLLLSQDEKLGSNVFDEVDKPKGMTSFSQEVLLRGACIVAAWKRGACQQELLDFLRALPGGATQAQGALERALRFRILIPAEEQAAELKPSPTGELIAETGAPPEAVLGWRTMLRRFPSPGGPATTLFLALGGGGAAALVPLSPAEREDGRWLLALCQQLDREDTALARYFAGFLHDPSGHPRSLHQAAKATLLVLDRDHHGLEDLEAKYHCCAGIIEEVCKQATYLARQVNSLVIKAGGQPVVAALESPGPWEVEARESVSAAAEQDPAPPPPRRRRRLVIQANSAGTVYLNGHAITLRLYQFRLLAALARRTGEGVRYESLEDQVWPDEKVERQQIRYHQRNLEKALEAVAPGPFIETLQGQGMRLLLEPEEVRFEWAEEEQVLREMEEASNLVASVSVW